MDSEGWPDAALGLVGTAVRAPSSHNTQPWAFRFRGDALLLYADRTRRLPVNDPHDRELHISCGAALFNLRLAAAYRRLTADVTLMPEPADPGLLARIALVPATVQGPQRDVPLYAEIGRRRTVRSGFTARPVPASALAAARDAAVGEGAGLAFLEPGSARRSAVAAVGEAGRRQFADRAWRRELASWTRPADTVDGLTVRVPMAAAGAARTLLRRSTSGPSTAGARANC
ncbi:hypothetical protein PUR49_19950 [Streptomyces sp. BE147]|uniref:Acg family FMN-binding oxidoreductase n=1 Tax=Streptomyces sp. BE147 TaxID=3002524 RepID=UPI002E7927AB|nr:hypothetical protein [Streptomyces sp. BE147]MEE1738769.1 hypothetical protein [Streptomyces sp. BE147]